MTISAKLAALFAVTALVAGCNTTGPASEAAPAIDNSGIARSCTPSTVDPAAGAAATATIAVGNDGGWCAVRLTEKDGRAFATGLVRVRPEHGRIVIEKTGNETQVRYFPASGFSGADTFTTALRSRTAGAADLVLKVNVTVARAS